MIRITFYPLGNADTTLIELENGKRVLVDYAHSKNGENDDDKKIDLASELRSQLDSKNLQFDIVAFTHADEDHTRGAADFFEFDFAEKYQGDGRVKINELWVPAAMILEPGLKGDDQVIRQEARYRLKNGSGVRVFSSPHLLDGWFTDNGLSPDSRKHLITDAGNVAPGMSLDVDGVEFFVHSPFAHRDGDTLQSRNDGSLFLQAVFSVEGELTKAILGADTTHEVLQEIIQITKYHGRDERLEWDIFKLSHHCSYLSLSSEKGTDITEPSEEIDWLFSNTNNGCYFVSPSKPIPDDDECDQPPHRQAANYYKKKASEKNGSFKVTMEHPNGLHPEPMIFEIGKYGPTLKKKITGGTAVVISQSSPKVG
ncbi:MAG: hypothetical protein KDD58_04655 [Bdellovibrionales bacterium]|nr:hypothetical protein [Bdellovibrionales bacterium]